MAPMDTTFQGGASIKNFKIIHYKRLELGVGWDFPGGQELQILGFLTTNPKKKVNIYLPR